MTTWLGYTTAIHTGRLMTARPNSSANHTCGCVWLSPPVQVSGVIQMARPTATTHWTTSNPANKRSVR